MALRAFAVALASAGCTQGVVDTPSWPQAAPRAVAPLSVIDVQLAAESSAITVAVVTQGSAERARLGCRLKRGTDVVAETATEFAPAGTSSTQFRLWREGGWAPGAYQLEVELDGHPAAARELRVGSGS